MRLTDRALGRAMLARQRLLTAWPPIDAGAAPATTPGTALVDIVESIGAVQAQYWPSIPVALWTRVTGFTADHLYRALTDRQLVVGTLLRRTLHLTSRAQHPAYAAVAEAPGGIRPTRLIVDSPATLALHAAVLAYAATPRTLAELGEFVEAYVGRHPEGLDEAEIARQRAYRFRPLIVSTDLVRVPRDGAWGARTPSAYQALEPAPAKPDEPTKPAPGEALAEVARRHLRAFGPAGADDVAAWTGWKVPPVRAALDALDLPQFTDETGRTLYDLPDRPRPDPDTPAPVRFLPAFDGALLGYAPARRSRILPEAYRGRVYIAANLKWLPTILVDGMVAGVWADAAKRHEARLTLTLFGPLSATQRHAVITEGEHLVRFLHARATDYHVVAGDMSDR